MSSGLLVISSHVDGMDDAYLLGVDGWLAPRRGFVERLAAAAKKWATDLQVENLTMLCHDGL